MITAGVRGACLHVRGRNAATSYSATNTGTLGALGRPQNTRLPCCCASSKGKSNEVQKSTGPHTRCGTTVVHVDFFRSGVEFRPNIALIFAFISSVK